MKKVNFQNRLIENSMDGFLGCDENQIIVTYNQSMEKLLGYSKAPGIEKNESVDAF